MDVLIVDDNEMLLDTLRRGLEISRIGEIYSESNPWDALAFLDRTPVDVIVCDLIMPAMNGLELHAETQRRYDKPPPFILLTGSLVCDVDFPETANLPVVYKPFDMIELIDVIVGTVEKSRSREGEAAFRKAAG